MDKRYAGHCQCGAVAYEAELDLDNAFTCNCSRCQPLGVVLSLTPQSRFTLKSGDDNLTEFRFNTKQIAHLFCRTCGVQCFALGQAPDGTPVAAINVNTLDGINPRELNTSHVDGRAL